MFVAADFRPVPDSATNTESRWAGGRPDLSPVEFVPIDSLLPARSPRGEGESEEHIRLLAGSEAALPPIIVHRPTMRVIDGMHRLRAAVLRGEEWLAVRYFSGSEPDAFVLAVQANVSHGLPLSVADRTAAAERILRSHPQWSDRAIAAATGLAAKTVAAIRRRAAEHTPEPPTRIGRDGRARPLSTEAARRRAGELIVEDPGASLRTVAAATGISPGTVRDVRDRLLRGEDPVPPAQRVGDTGAAGRREPERTEAVIGQAAWRNGEFTRLQVLSRDPSLRLTESGRHLLRLLTAHAIPAPQRDRLIDNIPAHCVGLVAAVARECAEAWAEVARRLEEKHSGLGRRAG